VEKKTENLEHLHSRSKKQSILGRPIYPKKNSIKIKRSIKKDIIDKYEELK